jgi:hypothetical protein
LFPGCVSLTDVNLNSNLTAIGERAFINCSKLESITLHDNLQTIGRQAFANTGLKSFTIPRSVTSVGEEILAGCGNLKYVIVNASTPPSTGGNDIFDDATFYSSVPLGVPDGKKTAYQNDAIWGKFTTMGEHTAAFAITTTTLPTGAPNVPYYAKLKTNGYPVEWSIVDKENEGLPNTLTLDKYGNITGTPTVAATYTFTVRAMTVDGKNPIEKTLTISFVANLGLTVAGIPVTTDNRNEYYRPRHNRYRFVHRLLGIG